MRPYLYIAKVKILIGLAYRFELFAALASNGIVLLASIFLWRTAYRGIDSRSGVGQPEMLTYAALAVLLGSAFNIGVQNTIQSRIRQGQIAIDFIRPFHPLGQWLAEDIGASLSAIVTHLLPLLLVALFFLSAPWPATWLAGGLFLPSCLLSFAILWLLGALAGMVAFWTIDLGNLGIVKDALVRVLSGSIVPIWFWPQPLQTISHFLPFEHTMQTPLGIYIGKIGAASALRAMGVQAAWLFVLGAITLLVWRCAHRRVAVQGG